MKIVIQVEDLKQLQKWITQTSTIAEQLNLPTFQFDFGRCKRCEGDTIHYPQAIDVKDDGFDILCNQCGAKLIREKENNNNGKHK